MKANAPERIWIDLATDLPKLSGHIDKDSVEYTRTDSFIEKAKEFLWEHIDGTDYHVNFILKEFEKYMKGGKV